MQSIYIFTICGYFLAFINYTSATVVAARCSDGIVIAADTLNRAGNGVLVSSRNARQIFMLTDSTVLCCASSSGNAALHFQQVYDYLRDITQEHVHKYGTQLATSAIGKVARQLITSQYPDAHVVIAGYDPLLNIADDTDRTNKVTEQASVDYVLVEILPGGTLLNHDSVAAGTGGSLIAGLLEEQLRDKRFDKPNSAITYPVFHSGEGRCINHGSANIGSECLPEDVLSRLNVSEAAALLRKCLQTAGRLDPQTGGDKYTMWALTVNSCS